MLDEIRAAHREKLLVKFCGNFGFRSPPQKRHGRKLFVFAQNFDQTDADKNAVNSDCAENRQRERTRCSRENIAQNVRAGKRLGNRDCGRLKRVGHVREIVGIKRGSRAVGRSRIGNCFRRKILFQCGFHADRLDIKRQYPLEHFIQIFKRKSEKQTERKQTQVCCKDSAPAVQIYIVAVFKAAIHYYDCRAANRQTQAEQVNAPDNNRAA